MPSKGSQLVAVLVFVLSLVCLGAPATAAGKPKCFPRQGHCLAAVINGQATAPLDKPTRKLLQALAGDGRESYAVGETQYRVPEPIHGELSVTASRVAGSESWFGAGERVEVRIVPLDDVEIPTEKRLVASSSVRIEGQAAVGIANTMLENRLPRGRYLFVVTLRGADNWDRQSAYVEVAGDD